MVPVLFGLGLEDSSTDPRRRFVGETDRSTVAGILAGSVMDAVSVKDGVVESRFREVSEGVGLL